MRDGHAGEHAVALGEDRKLRAWRRTCRYVESVLSEPIRPRPAPEVAWINAGTDFKFGSAGKLTARPLRSRSPASRSAGNPRQPRASASAPAASRNTPNTGGTMTINTISQNGYPAGQSSRSPSATRASSSARSPTARTSTRLGDAVALQRHQLSQGARWRRLRGHRSSRAGDRRASGTISGSSLEGSNTDIADEFTKLIVTQQAYSANTKVITTANSMVQDLLNVLR